MWQLATRSRRLARQQPATIFCVSVLWQALRR